MDRGTQSGLLVKPPGMSDKEWLDHLLGQQKVAQPRPAGWSDQQWLDHLLGQAQQQGVEVALVAGEEEQAAPPWQRFGEARPKSAQRHTERAAQHPEHGVQAAAES